MKRTLLRLLPVAAVLLTASCTDNDYDFNDVDTTSEFRAKDLVVPLNMSPISLDAIISIDENSEIKKDKDGYYYFQKECSEPFKSDDVNVEKITIKKPDNISQDFSITLSNRIFDWEMYAADKTLGEIMEDPVLKQQVGINEGTPIIEATITTEAKHFDLNATNIDTRVTKLDKLCIDDLPLNIKFDMGAVQDVINNFHITGLIIKLPCGLTIKDFSSPGVIYDSEKGELSFMSDAGENIFDMPGQTIMGTVTNLDYNAMNNDGANFDVVNHTFTYEKTCHASGTVSVRVQDLNPNTTLNAIKAAESTPSTCIVSLGNDLVVNTFSGGIDYTINDINIDPVKIENLPEFLQGNGTSIEVANPQLYLTINNPFFENNITAQAGLSITGNKSLPVKQLTFDKPTNKQVLSPEDKDLYHEGYKPVQFTELKELLTGDKIPETLDIKVVNPVLNADNVKDFTLGVNHPGITGTWDFYSKLHLTGNSKIGYTKEWNDWQSKDLDGLTVEKATVAFKFAKKIVLDAESIEFTLMGKDGNLYGITRDVKGEGAEVKIPMTPTTGKAISGIYGGKLVVKLKGQDDVLKNDQNVVISDLRMTIDGKYTKEF